MNTEKLTLGELVYTAAGGEVILISVEQDGYVVRPLLGTGNAEMGEDDLGDPELVGKVYASPPAERMAAVATEAQAKAEEAQGKVQKARAELREIEAEIAERRRMLSSHPDLQPVIEYMEGQISHLATIDWNYGIKIMTIREAVNAKGDRGKPELRMLALYGGFTGPDGRGNRWDEGERYPHWKLAAYCDGSGSTQHCVIGPSEEKLRERVQLRLDEMLKKPGGRTHLALGLAMSAVAKGFTVSPEWAAQVEAAKKNHYEQSIKSAKAYVADAEAKLEKYRRELADLEVGLEVGKEFSP